jgi:hypothetical protein
MPITLAIFYGVVNALLYSAFCLNLALFGLDLVWSIRGIISSSGKLQNCTNTTSTKSESTTAQIFNIFPLSLVLCAIPWNNDCVNS